MFLNFTFSNDAMGYMVDGVVDDEAIRYLRAEIEARLEEEMNFNLYLEDTGIVHFSWNAIIIGMSFPHKHKTRFRKVAMVTDKRWIHVLSWLNNLVLPIKIKSFITRERLIAMSWISEK